MIYSIDNYDLNEVLSNPTANATFTASFADYPLLQPAIDLIQNLYNDWIALKVKHDETPDFNAIANKWSGWIKAVGKHYNDLLALEVKDTSKRTSRFNDTPESKGDYSDLEHTTTINVDSAETSSFANNYEKAKLEPLYDFIERFRKEWLVYEW